MKKNETKLKNPQCLCIIILNILAAGKTLEEAHLALLKPAPGSNMHDTENSSNITKTKHTKHGPQGLPATLNVCLRHVGLNALMQVPQNV